MLSAVKSNKFAHEIPIKKMISNSPQLKSFHIENVDMTDEQLYHLMEQFGVTITVGYKRKQDFEKYISYQWPENIEKYSSRRIFCKICEVDMML